MFSAIATKWLVTPCGAETTTATGESLLLSDMILATCTKRYADARDEPPNFNTRILLPLYYIMLCEPKRCVMIKTLKQKKARYLEGHGLLFNVFFTR
jgi:hypothetical protein